MNPRMLAEVYAVIMSSGQEYIDLIPHDIIEFISEKKDDRYVPLIDENKPLDQQGFEKATIAMIAMIKLEYWCKTEEQRAELQALLDANEQALQEQLESSSSTRELLSMLRKH